MALSFSSTAETRARFYSDLSFSILLFSTAHIYNYTMLEITLQDLNGKMSELKKRYTQINSSNAAAHFDFYALKNKK